MKTTLERVFAVLGSSRPTAPLCKEVFNQLSETKRNRLRKDLFFLAFVHWKDLPLFFRRFLVRLFIQDRELLLCYLLEDTPLGELRCPLYKPDLLLTLLHILEKSKVNGRKSYLHLAFSLLIAFRYPYTLRTLAEYLRTKQPVAGELLQLAGLIEITGDFD
ncbi:hypothetical protein [Massilibacteroides vaginae]|nr:hypothetical protein [Massilibacteroides vaginae]